MSEVPVTPSLDLSDEIITASEAPRLLTVSALPHVHSGASVQRTMLWACVALLPATLIAVLLSGLHALYSILLSISAATAAEWIILFFTRKKPLPPDGSALLTGLLLALSLPPNLPLWVAPLGSLFAIVLVKMSFGGLGRNFLNPAMAGRAFLALSFPVLFSAATAHGGMALPATLPEINGGLINFLTGYDCGWLGSASAGALFAGAILLWSLRIIDFALPLSFIGSAYLLFWCTGIGSHFFSAAALLGALLNLLSSGVLFGAFFVAVDPVTSPGTKRSRILYGCGCGVLTFLFQKYGSRDKGMMAAILLMNFTVPYFDRYLTLRIPETKRRKREVSFEPEVEARENDPAADAPAPEEKKALTGMV